MSRSHKNLELIRPGFLFVLLAAASAVALQGQSSPANPGTVEPKPQAAQSPIEPNQTVTADPNATISPPATPEQIRQAQIEADTKKLYQLSAELRAEVAKTYKESLSLTVLKKAEEIEKLSRSLKTRINQEAAARR